MFPQKSDRQVAGISALGMSLTNLFVGLSWRLRTERGAGNAEGTCHTHTHIYTHTVYTYNMVVMVIVGLMVEIYPGVTKKYADDMLAYYSCNVVTG